VAAIAGRQVGRITIWQLRGPGIPDSTITAAVERGRIRSRVGARLLPLLTEAALPIPEANARIRTGGETCDALAAAGYRIPRLGWEDLRDRPDAEMAEIARLLRERSSAGARAQDPRVLPCTP
jgi:hypothetical protein